MKLLRIAFCSYLLLVSLLAISQPSVVLAQNESTIEEKIEINAKYPKVEIISGQTAVFEVELALRGEIGGEPRTFDLAVTGPKDWYMFMTPSYPKDKMIAAIELLPGYTAGEKILVNAGPAGFKPEAGEHVITLEATSGEIKATYELTVVVTAKYTLTLVPATELYSTSATAGKENIFSIEVQNDGTAAIDDINLHSGKPGEWSIDFSPDKIGSLAAGNSLTVEVNITPPARAIAGDYVITLRANGKQATAKDLTIRVTVKTPTAWGWVGVGIVLVVIAGIVFIFMRFSRR